MEKDIVMDIVGLGWIMYSDFAVSGIKEGEDYLSTQYWDSNKVAEQVNSGKIVGVCIDPGSYIFKVRKGYPMDDLIVNSKFKMRLCIQVKENKIYIRDLYDLMSWNKNCPEEQIIEVENGNYEVLVMSNKPNSGYIGEDQVIFLYFNKREELPRLKFQGVPQLLESGRNIREEEILRKVI